MKKNKLFVCILLISGLFLLNLFIQPFPNKRSSQIIQNSNENMIRKSEIAGQWTLFRHFGAVAGDFGNWKPCYYMGADFLIYDNTGPDLVMKVGDADEGIEEGYTLNNVPDISTNEIRNYSFLVSYSYSQSLTYNYVKGMAFFTDLTNQTLFNKTMQGAASSCILWHNGSFSLDKVLDYIVIQIHCGAILTAIVTLKDELYYGYSPNITEYQILGGGLDLNTPHYFYLISENAYSAALIIQSVETGGWKTEELERDWIYPTLFFKDLILTREGIFSCFYIARNVWGAATTTTPFAIYTYDFPFPAISYLNVRSYEYRDIPEELFYVFLGDSESVVLFDFKTLFGNWKTMGSCSFAYGLDRIIFNCSNGGIKSDFSHIAPGRQYDLQNLTLEFDVKTSRDRLVLIINPTRYDYDYLLWINETYQDKWVTVRIPFYMFQSFPGALSYIGEIGFYSNFGYYELANIKICNYYFSTVLINSTAETYTAKLGDQENLFASNFNYTNHFQSENITISENETLELEYYSGHTGHYSAEYSFTYDTIGGDPTGWSIVEDANTHVDIVEIKDDHKMDVELWDNNNGAWMYPELYQTFAPQTTGTFEFWIRGTKKDSNSYCYFWLKSGATTAITIVWNFWTGKIEHAGTSYGDLQNTIWTHIRIDFDCGTDKFDLYQDSVKIIDQKSFDTGTANLDTFYQITGSGCANNFYLWLDAIDYSWASGYYLNRNLNDTAGFVGYAIQGYYISPSFDLGENNYYYYQDLNFSQEIQLNTTLTLQYRTSTDNSSWSDWNTIPENITINQFKNRYFQFCANLTSTNSSCTSRLFWLNLSYLLCDQNVIHCFINISNPINLLDYEELSFWYNFSNSQANLYLQFYYNGSWYNITQLNSTKLNYGLGNSSVTTRFDQCWRNITLDNNYTQIRLYFAIANLSSIDNTVQIKRFECINLSIYRLKSEINRQRYDILIFQKEPQTLLLVDFAGREIYRKEINYSQYIDVYLNIAEITLINYLNITAWFIFESRGVSLVYGVAAESQRNILVLLDDYFVRIVKDNLSILDVRDISITSTNKTTISIGVKPVEVIPVQPNLLELIWEAIIIICTHPIGITFIVLFLLYGIYRLYKRHKTKKDREIQIYKRGYADGLAARNKLIDSEIQTIFMGV